MLRLWPRESQLRLNLLCAAAVCIRGLREDMGLHADAAGLLCCGYRAPGSVWWVLGPPFSNSRAAELSPPASILSAILKEVKVLPWHWARHASRNSPGASHTWMTSGLKAIRELSKTEFMMRFQDGDSGAGAPSGLPWRDIKGFKVQRGRDTGAGGQSGSRRGGPGPKESLYISLILGCFAITNQDENSQSLALG